MNTLESKQVIRHYAKLTRERDLAFDYIRALWRSAVCEESHKKIEGNLSWARENGYSLNF